MARHLDWVDSARGLAILGIVAVHAAQGVSGLPGWAERFAGAGRYGVQVFLLASGLTILLSITRRSTDPRPGVWRRFHIRRFARIALVAYAGMIANILVFHPPRTPLGVGLTMVFLSGWSPEWYNTLILGGWMLSAVWMFYLSVPLLSNFVRSTRDAVVLVFVSDGS